MVVAAAAHRAALAEACAGQEHVGQAPVVIVGCAEVNKYKDHSDKMSHLLDVAVAMTQMTLQALYYDFVIEAVLAVSRYARTAPERQLDIALPDE